ncbi:hypothetical protein Tco_0598577 [Tanacetum coccineum]
MSGGNGSLGVMMVNKNVTPSLLNAWQTHQLSVEVETMEHQVTLLCDIDPMMNDVKVLTRCISIRKSHAARKPNEPSSLDTSYLYFKFVTIGIDVENGYIAARALSNLVELFHISSPDKNPFYQLSRSSRKEVQVCVSVFSGTLSEGYRWKDRHGIEKTFCRVAKSLGSWGQNNESGWGTERTEPEAMWGSNKPEKETKKGLGTHHCCWSKKPSSDALKYSMYDSWASRIRLFIKGKKHGRMMLDSIDNGLLVYPTVKENGQTRPKKYFELSETQQLQDDCDVQATNIILHGLPPDGVLHC